MTHSHYSLYSVPLQACRHLNETAGADARIGVSSLAIMPAAWHQQLQEQVRAKQWVEAGDLIWKLRLVQSEEEVAMSRRAAELGDRVWDHLRDFIREGVTELEIRAEMDRVIIPGGGPENFNMMGLGGMADGGEAPWGYVIPQPDRPVRRGDALLLEISPRVRGYWTQIVRVLTLGEAERWLIDAHQVVREARDASLAHLKPGEPMVAMVRAMNETFEKNGYEVWPYGLVHLTGLDLTDYMITPVSEGVLAPGMVVTTHPMFNLGADRQIFWGETYLVTDDGHEPLNRSTDELACL